MAGSRRNFQYTTDLGNIYIFSGDESNTEAVNGTEGNIASINVQEGIPRNIKPRRVRYTNVEQTRVISPVCVTPALYNAVPATIPDPIDPAAGILFLIGKNPEKVRVYKNLDTGLTDGDAPL